MEVLKIIGIILLSIIWFCWVADVEVSFSPFKVTAKSWMFALGWVLIILGIILTQVDMSAKVYKNAKLEGYQEATDDILSYLRNEYKDKANN